MLVSEAIHRIEGRKYRSAWSKGVAAYAVSMLEDLPEDTDLPLVGLQKLLLNGARDWKQYSWGGCALVYDADIATRLCNPTELKLTRNGQRRPNAAEEWLDVQARACRQAAMLIADVVAETCEVSF